MAKALKKKQPYSSVDRFFSGASLDAALAPQEEEPQVEPIAEEVVTEAKFAEEPMVEVTAPQPEIVVPAPAPFAAPPVFTESRVLPKAERRLPPQERPVAQKVSRPAMTIVPPRAAPQERTAEPVDRQREFQLTRSTDETLEDLVLLYKRATGAEVTRSHILRAVLKAIAERMPALKREAEAIGPLRRPSNARGFEEAREEFEEQIKTAFVRGIA
jgi:hypothetical protein